MCWLSSYVTQKTEWLHVGAVEVKNRMLRHLWRNESEMLMSVAFSEAEKFLGRGRESNSIQHIESR